MSGAAKCGRIRGWMADAASGSLSEARRGAFEKHVADCAVCRTEFAQVENLFGQIDQSLRTAFTVEPSPKLVLNVRESIAAETQSAQWSAGWLRRNSWLGAAGVCAAVAALLILMIAHRVNRSVSNGAQNPQIANSAPAQIPSQPRRSASAENPPPRAPSRRHARSLQVALAHQESPRNARVDSTEPEVIVQPGQMQAILQFVADVRKGRIDGAEIEKGIQAARKPLHVEPLEVVPLETSAGGANGTPAANSREPGSANGPSR